MSFFLLKMVNGRICQMCQFSGMIGDEIFMGLFYDWERNFGDVGDGG